MYLFNIRGIHSFVLMSSLGDSLLQKYIMLSQYRLLRTFLKLTERNKVLWQVTYLPYSCSIMSFKKLPKESSINTYIITSLLILPLSFPSCSLRVIFSVWKLLFFWQIIFFRNIIYCFAFDYVHHVIS